MLTRFDKLTRYFFTFLVVESSNLDNDADDNMANGGKTRMEINGKC